MSKGVKAGVRFFYLFVVFSLMVWLVADAAWSSEPETGPEMLTASYYLLDTTLVLTFDKPVVLDQVRYERIGFEVDGSCEWDIQLSEFCEFSVQVHPTDPNTIMIDIFGDAPAMISLGASILVHNAREINVLLGPGAFTDGDGLGNEAVDCPAGIPLDIDCVIAPFTYIIVASAGPNGAIAPEGNVLVEHGQNRQFTITPDYGYGIDTVLVDGQPVSVEIDDYTGIGTYTFTRVTSNHTIYATFQALGPYTITATAGSGGDIDPEGSLTVNYGANQQFTITPDDCRYVESVTVDGDPVVVDESGVVTYTLSGIKDNHQVHATFGVVRYGIVSSTTGNGTIDPELDQLMNCGSSVTFTLEPDDCYRVGSLVVNGTSVDVQIDENGIGTYTLELLEDTEASASFEKITYTIVPTAGEGGTIDPDCTDIDDCVILVECGECLTFSVLADPCYEIDQVYIDGELFEEPQDDGSDVVVERVLNTYTFLDVREDHTIHATFKKKLYTITAIDGSGGTIDPSGEVTVECGSSKTFTIAPDTCYEINEVIVDDESVGRPTQYTFEEVTEDHEIVALFYRRICAIEATAGVGGTVTPTYMEVGCGSNLTLNMEPDDCYRAAGVTGAPADAVIDLQAGTIGLNNIMYDYDIHVMFAELGPYTITSSAGSNGAISPEGASSVPCGGDRNYTIIPDPGYRIVDVIVDSSSVNVVNEYMFEYVFEDVHGDHSISATFGPAPGDLILLAARFDVCNPTLILSFNKLVNPSLTTFGKVGMEIDNSGDWDIHLRDGIGLTAVQGEPYTVSGETYYPVMIDPTCALTATTSLVSAAFVTHKSNDIDVLLERAAFTAMDGGRSKAADVSLDMTINGYIVGVLGDVTGDGVVTAYDAALILQSVVYGMSVFTIYEEAQAASDTLAGYGIRHDVMRSIANFDCSANGDITSNDAAEALRFSAGFPVASCAPISNMTRRSGRLQVNECADHRLEISIDLDDVSGVYSADIVVTYDPQVLTVADVSRASAVSEWMFEQGTTGTGQLRIALAGASQPSEDGSLVSVSFDAASADAIKQLKLTEFKLNGGILKASIEHLPKAFALLQNYPNPFNPETWIPYRLSEPGNVTVIIYNTTGQMVRRLELGHKMPGHYVDKSRAVYWDGRNEWGEKVSSGIYFYQLQANQDTSVRKMIIAQ